MIGIDVVAIRRFEEMKGLSSFLVRWFSPEERRYLSQHNNHAETVAGMFAAKEAFLKAMGCGVGSISLSEVVVAHDHLGAPYICFHGERVPVSITHDGGIAVAVVMLKEVCKALPSSMHEWDIFLRPREVDGHKGTYGRIALFGGALGMVGSICLSTMAALRSGAGLVYCYTPVEVVPLAQGKLLEGIVKPGGEITSHFDVDWILKEEDFFSKLQGVGIGPGLSEEKQSVDLIRGLFREWEGPMVLDAGALNALSRFAPTESFSHRVVMTPHLQEFARLCACSLEEVLRDREAVAKRYAIEHEVVLVLKGHKTLVTDGTRVYYNTTGNPGMATAGSGDVLTGVLTALVARGVDLFQTACFAVFLHGLAGDIACEALGEDGMLASDILHALPEAYRRMKVENGGKRKSFSS